MSRTRFGLSAILTAALVVGGTYVFAGDAKPADTKAADTKAAVAAASSETKSTDSTLNCEGCAPLDAKDISAKMAKLKALEGTWVVAAKGDQPAHKSTFHVIANGTAVVETMLPGTKHEMVNVYHPTTDGVMVTHYCAEGVQPRMKLASDQGKSLKFVFVDCTNLKSRDQGHMDSLELTIDGDRLVEEWSYFKDGKVIDSTKFESKREQPGQANATK